VFADTSYYIALSLPDDRWHEKADLLDQQLQSVPIITTEGVLVEFLTFFSGFGSWIRRAAVELARSVLADPHTEVLPQTHELFLAGLEFYEQRPDKQYSLQDCISMQVMRQRGLFEVLTNDHHFEQEGFVILLRD
jgi:uncharacterized protein